MAWQHNKDKCHICSKQPIRYCEDCARPYCEEHEIEIELSNFGDPEWHWICSECNEPEEFPEDDGYYMNGSFYSY